MKVIVVEGAKEKWINSIEYAWTIIANASGGDWSKQSKEWQESAENFRDNHYHKVMIIKEHKL